MWVACKVLKVGRGQEIVTVSPGQPVPEAAAWPNLRVYTQGKDPYVKWVDDGSAAATAAVAAASAALAMPAVLIPPPPAQETPPASPSPSAEIAKPSPAKSEKKSLFGRGKKRG